MSLRRLRWISVVVAFAFLAGLDVLRHALFPALLHDWLGVLLIAGLTLAGMVGFSGTVFAAIGRMQARSEQQTRELLALHQAGLDVAGELRLEAVLQKAVDQARDLVGARYGALGLLAEGGGVEAFLTSGITAEERARTGPPPVGHGLLGLVLKEGRSLRLRDLTRHPGAVGFPEHHPPMRSLLAVPIFFHGRVLGSLYLTEKQVGSEFGPHDEESLVRFATQAALAIENARLHRRVRELAIVEERERIAREMHDSLAQVLGYVNTKAQAIQTLLRRGQVEPAAAQVEQLGEAARAAYADVREAILGLRTTLGAERDLREALQEYVQQWQEQSGVAAELLLELPEGALRGLPPTSELQLLRIVQEALANARKHAGASRVVVTARAGAGLVEATVEDDGRGFDPTQLGSAAFPRFGLATMRERAESVGGTLEVASARGAGTRVTVRVPARGPSRSEGEVHAGAHR